jgi:hypothetical protein
MLKSGGGSKRTHREAMVRTCKVLVPCAVLAVSLFCLAFAWQPAALQEDATVTRTTSTRVSMLRRAKQDSGSMETQSPLLQVIVGSPSPALSSESRTEKYAAEERH